MSSFSETPICLKINSKLLFSNKKSGFKIIEKNGNKIPIPKASKITPAINNTNKKNIFFL